MSEPKARNELFVRSIPAQVNNQQLAEFFSEIAPVRHATVVMDSATGESRGFGFVSFTTADDAKDALNGIKGKRIHGKILQVDYAKPRERKGDKSASKTGPDSGLSSAKPESDNERRRPRLIVRNVPWSLRDPKELETIFSKFGKVTEAFIPRGANNRMSGFAFVTMRRKVGALEAVEKCKDLKIHGRQVAVDLAVAKNKWDSGSAKADDIESDPESEDEDEDENEDEDEDEDVKDAKKEAELNGDADEDADAGSDDDEEEDDEEEEEDEEEDEEEKPKRKPVSEDQTIFVRNVPYAATEESLKEHFEVFGPVAYALPVIDKNLNQPKGVAFVGFHSSKSARKCVESAPDVKTSSLLIPDDVDPRYVYEGRILGVTEAVSKDRASHLSQKGATERLDVLGKAPGKNDKRNLFLLNEGRVTSNSKLAEVISASEMQIRDKSFQLRKQQLAKNPSLHLSMTRLAIRNLPRSMDEKALKALGRKAVVEFATQVAEKQRQPLSKEEVMRSIHFQESLGEQGKSKHGVVKQSKVVMEVKEAGKMGRSRGYGFLEMRNHKAALMALRYLNGHQVTKEELGGTHDADSNRRLVVEFSIENAQVLKRQRERHHKDVEFGRKRKAQEEADAEEARAAAAAERSQKRGNEFVGRKRKFKRMKRS